MIPEQWRRRAQFVSCLVAPRGCHFDSGDQKEEEIPGRASQKDDEQARSVTRHLMDPFNDSGAWMRRAQFVSVLLCSEDARFDPVVTTEYERWWGSTSHIFHGGYVCPSFWLVETSSAFRNQSHPDLDHAIEEIDGTDLSANSPHLSLTRRFSEHISLNPRKVDVDPIVDSPKKPKWATENIDAIPSDHLGLRCSYSFTKSMFEDSGNRHGKSPSQQSEGERDHASLGTG
ncbi:hypothetical protein BDV95DRAFT_570540 [Massariosphaeria phaeospora]|uniref:Endonuclease/exonuclease/phosphatase n=1 Tax=Massariosphaeria phaeospora TaxID=100035 RepID=A0A7C8IFC9_9PLEO|nr:hypothetical protein BDV95DRAFT_570540 [Massariosphaeria phaeospora]